MIGKYLGVMVVWIGGLTGVANANEINHRAEYQACMSEALQKPDSAYVRAVRWRDLGGGYGADHCAATAMMGMHQYRDAAVRLERLAQTGRVEVEIKAQLLGQAAQAWLMADEPALAEANATAGLSLLPGNIELLIDRAQAMAARKDYTGALNDLDKVLAFQPGRADAFIFRATAKRFLDDLQGAMDDINQALAIDTRQVDGFLERGILHRLMNNPNAARQDWLQVLRLDPESEAAIIAQRNLENMDVKVQ